MRLGLWNRLAVVAAAITLTVCPIWWLIEQQSRYDQMQQAFYDVCLQMTKSYPDQMFKERAAAEDKCRADRLKFASSDVFSWEHWFENLGVAALICTAVYGLIFGVVSTIKWIWRGRGA